MTRLQKEGSEMAKRSAKPVPRSGLIDSGEANRLIGRPSGSAHELILATARAMAHELYDVTMQNNEWYALWRSWHPEGTTAAELEASFVRRNTPRLLAGARTVLAGMLRTSPDPALRETIMDALLLDATLTRARGVMQ
jgi:hypothetical protein